MNIYDALSKDHRKFEALLDQLVTTSKTGNDQWKSTLDELRHEVITHAHAEEAVFYNGLREGDESKKLVLHGYTEHAAAETEIRTLGAAKAVDANWTSLIEKFSKDLRHHIEEEETRIYDAARKVLTDDEAMRMGEAFERMKIEMAGDADSMVASTVDLLANLLPPRFSQSFRKGLESLRKSV